MKTLLLALLPTCLALQRQHDSGCPLTGGGGVSDALAFQPVLTGDSGHVQVIRLDDSETYDPKIPENAQGQPDVASDPTDYISFVQPDQSLECPDQPLQVHIINPQEPLIAYISNFVSDEEADYLIRERYSLVFPSVLAESKLTAENVQRAKLLIGLRLPRRRHRNQRNGAKIRNFDPGPRPRRQMHRTARRGPAVVEARTRARNALRPAVQGERVFHAPLRLVRSSRRPDERRSTIDV